MRDFADDDQGWTQYEPVLRDDLIEFFGLVESEIDCLRFGCIMQR